MNSYKEFKFQILLPNLAKLLTFLIGSRNKGTQGSIDTKNKFFIFGSGRNGSTLLALLLNNHSDVFLPPEQYALPYTILKWHLFRFYDWNKISKIIVTEFRQKNQNWDFSENDFESIIEKLKKVEKKNRNITTVYEQIICHFGNKKKKDYSLIGDHSPLMTGFYSLLLDEFPNSKIIFLVRDPRDVILSYSKFKKSALKGHSEAAEKWNDSIDVYFSLLKENKEKVILISYEDLVNKTENTMGLISDFLNIPFEEATTKQLIDVGNDPLNVDVYEHHKNLYKPIFNSSIGKWRNALSKETIDEITPIVEKNAIKLGYFQEDVLKKN